jgi:hypothetical protein
LAERLLKVWNEEKKNRRRRREVKQNVEDSETAE